MLRRTLLVFVGFAMLVLALTVGYALAGFSSPKTVVTEAEDAVTAGRFDEAIRHLDRAEQALARTPDAELRVRILRLRQDALRRSGNLPRALVDIDTLLNEHPDQSRDLVLEKVHVLLQNRQPEAARTAVLAHLGQHPDDGRAHELAGEAWQRIYQEQVRELVADLGRKLDATELDTAIKALQTWLYRQDGDVEGERGRATFDRILRSRRPAEVTEYRTRILPIRSGIKTALDHFAKSLADPDHTPVGAYRGIAYALQQGRRDDDLVALSTIYLQRFDHLYTLEAALHAARTHLEAGRHTAVRELCRSFLPPGVAVARARERKLPRAYAQLILVEARALHALGERDAMRARVDESWQVHLATGFDLGPEANLCSALTADLEGNHDEVWNQVGHFLNYLEVREASGATDLLPLACKLRLRSSHLRTNATERTRAAFEPWLQFRGSSAEPFLWRACWHLERGDGSAALNDAMSARAIASQDEHVLLVHVAAADRKFASEGRDAAALLSHCVGMGTTLPKIEVPDPVLWIALARHALAKGVPDVAQASARRAAQAFPWARTPRLLQARAALALDDAPQAITALENARGYHPDDPETLQLLRQARAIAKRPVSDLYFEIATTPVPTRAPTTLTELLEDELRARDGRRASAPADRPDPELAAALMSSALRRNDIAAATSVASRAVPRARMQPQLLLTAAEVFAAAGLRDGARRVLTSLFAATHAADRPTAARAGAQLLLLDADGPPAAVEAIAGVVGELLRDDRDTALRVATVLSRFGRAKAAYAVLRPTLARTATAADRTGADYLLAGRLAMELGNLIAAEEHFTAALAFPDGRAAGIPLALLLLDQKRRAEADEAFAADRATDWASAGLLVRLDRAERTRGWLADQLAKTPNDLRLQCFRALVDREAPVVGDIRQLVAERELLLDVLTLTETPGFQSRAAARAEQLRAAFPKNVVARFLWAQAHAAAKLPEAAIDELTRLSEEHPNFPPTYDALVAILAAYDPARLAEFRLPDQVSTTLVRLPNLATPRLMAWIRQDVAKRFFDAGDSKRGAELLAELWTLYPVESRAGDAQLDALIESRRFDQAMTLLRNLEPHLGAERRERFLAMFFRHADQLASSPDVPVEIRAAVRRKAAQVLAEDGPFGPAVHFTLDDEVRTAGPIPERRDAAAEARVARSLKLLADHVDWFRAGRETDELRLVASLERLARLETPTTTMRRTESLLREDPSLFRVWHFRARLLADAGNVEAALACLRWIDVYRRDVDALLLAGELRARSGADPDPEESRLLVQLDAATAATPRAAFVLGMLAFRGGRAEDAERLLTDADPSAHDGAVEYFRAMAAIAHGDAGAHGRARDALVALRDDHPSSSLAENVGLLLALLPD